MEITGRKIQEEKEINEEKERRKNQKGTKREKKGRKNTMYQFQRGCK